MPSAGQGGKWRGSTELAVGQDLGIGHVTGMPQGRLTVTYTPAPVLLTLSPSNWSHLPKAMQPHVWDALW